METSGSKMGSAGPSSAMFEPSSMDKLDNGRAEPNLVNIDTQHTSEKIAIEGALPQHQGMQKVPFVAHSATSNIGESKLSENSGDYETLDTSTEQNFKNERLKNTKKEDQILGHLVMSQIGY